MKYEFDKLTNILEVVKLRDSFDFADPLWHQAEARLRELLEVKYGDEQALCMKGTFVPSYIKPGFTPISEVPLPNGLKGIDLVREFSRVAEFVPRTYCEYNPLYKQIIPYIIGVTPDKKIFTMERIKGDDRLIGKVSIGIGGHINTEDEGADTITVGAKRELREEVQDVSTRAYLTFEGFLYDPSDQVGLDHIGFIFFYHLPDESISVREKDTLKGSLCTSAELSEKQDRMENWTRIVYDNLLR